MREIPQICARQKELAEWRRHLHSYPELAYQESRTATFVAERLESFGLDVDRGLAGTGVVGSLVCGDGPSIGLRADMDALPIAETNEFGHRSRHDGVMHACGHDGHMTMLLGAAQYLASHGQLGRGRVHFIFQPAEEAAGGAKRMVDDGLFERYPVDAVFGMHNWPGLTAGSFATRSGPLMASMDCFDIDIHGRSAHGALPHQGADAIAAAAQLVTSLHTIVSRNVSPLESAALSVTRIRGGDSHNVLPDTVSLGGAIRCFSPQLRAKLRQRFDQLVEHVTTAFDVSATIAFAHEFPAVVNAEGPTAIAVSAASALVGDAHVDAHASPVMVSEDFSFMLERVPGCFLFIGNGGTEGVCGLHNARYDFNDEILSIGASYWASLAERFVADSVP